MPLVKVLDRLRADNQRENTKRKAAKATAKAMELQLTKVQVEIATLRQQADRAREVFEETMKTQFHQLRSLCPVLSPVPSLL